MRVILILFLILTPASLYADTTYEVTESLSQVYPLGGYSVTGGAVIFYPEFTQHGYTEPTQAEIDALVADYTSLAKVKARKLEEVNRTMMLLAGPYNVYFNIPPTPQAVIDYITALRNLPAAAQTDLAALPDVESVKNYQPAWPAKPGL